MAPISKLLGGWLCGIGQDSSDPPTQHPAPSDDAPALSGATRVEEAAKAPTPPHELPALTFSEPLTAPDLPAPAQTRAPGPGEPALALPASSSPLAAGGTGTLPPPAVVLPKLAQLRQVESPTLSHSVTPPTPIDPTPSSSSTDPSRSSSFTRPSTPPSSTHSPEPSTSTLTTPHLVPLASPNLTISDQRSRSPARGAERGHHRRSSSQGTTGSRSFRETLNAYAVEGADGSRSVNQYVLGETLGRGSYATVERAVDRETGQEYAIKEFSKRRLRQIAAAEAQRRDRITNRLGGQTEVAIMKKVDHPNLASVHEVIDVTSDDALLIMELCHGGPILKVRDGEQVTPFSEEEARNIFRQLVLGIAYLHHNQIIHRDIKPDNALFSDSLRTHVKLVDFGVSKFAAAPHPGLDEHQVAGSPAYMAPELLLSGAGADERAEEVQARTADEANAVGYACDVWSSGVTLYTLVTGKLPFQASDPVEMFRQIREDDPKIPSSLSPDLQRLLSSLLDKSPTTRPTIPSLWSDAWLTLNGSRPLPSYESNVQREIADPSSDEVDHALAVFRGSAFLAMSAAAKFKGLLTAAAVRRASAGGSTPPTSPPPPGQEAQGGVMVDSPEMVASPFSSPLGSPAQSPSPSPVGTRTTQPGPQARMRAAGRGAPRQQTTMSSLSIGSAAGGLWGASGDDEDEEEARARERDEEGSPTPVPPSPSAVVHGGEEVLSASMAAAGVDRPVREEGEERWEEPE
ncbi:hypothetical protein JCM10450v2_002579 [Rhodotorula kratochvilovae]